MTTSDTLQSLQTALSMELTAMHQYQLHAHTLEDWGLNRLAAKMREEMQEEQGHSDEFIRRILFLKGEPELGLKASPHRATTLKDMFEADLADEREAVAFYARSAREAAGAGDIGSRALFEKIALDEEGHMGWLELQLSLIERLGEQVYAAKQLGLYETEDVAPQA
jgi:bacterioferritin